MGSTNLGRIRERRLGDTPKDAKAQSKPGAKPSAFNYRRARDIGMAAGMAREQSAGVLCAVLVEEGSTTDKERGSLGFLVMSIIHGVKEKTGPLPPREGRGIIGCPRAAAQSGRRLRCDTRRIVQTLQD